MEIVEESTSRHVSIGFPLGLALLVTLILFMCFFFCCCIHWEKIEAFLISYGVINNPHHPHMTMQQPDLPSTHHQNPSFLFPGKECESLPVVMPGDVVPRFMGIACACQPPTHHHEMIQIQLQKPPLTQQNAFSNCNLCN
ncbi:uncharacterized protein At5g65660-like [Arachis stenosperma]|uniref:uncharacterized protein At5g65660-like n=1 Tax=Arachis stenosperma TaxID=217475 RepID=UPI0025AD8E96|nr:uncharacterized protein At5g65660-like [Arachis stenosperma]